ncbi:Probable serine/threonine-protein kinase GCN2 [Striga hermonthica]|uniref:Probable serine/threonine-protein kinase GCN2 n=1 Tax=Striga hermonthica TaxID=68872 RepID=A0A9N7P414_STRHE|nr:Probable serine/threonine-protein kinase GCN2 [Striga hermonthica]
MQPYFPEAVPQEIAEVLVHDVPLQPEFNDGCKSRGRSRCLTYAWIKSQMSGCVYGKTESGFYQMKTLTLFHKKTLSPCLYILMELYSRWLLYYNLNACLLNLIIIIEITVFFCCLSDYLEDLKYLEFFSPILRRLRHIHSKGFIHGDMSLSNVSVGSGNTIKIGDFGLDGGFVKFSNSDGIRLYKAPERVFWSWVDMKIGMYSLGIIFLEILHPFPTAYEKQNFIDNMKKGMVEEDLVYVYTPIIRRLISNDPNERPDVAQVMAKFENLVFGIP